MTTKDIAVIRKRHIIGMQRGSVGEEEASDALRNSTQCPG
jgi:hypothetical protein